MRPSAQLLVCRAVLLDEPPGEQGHELDLAVEGEREEVTRYASKAVGAPQWQSHASPPVRLTL